MPPEVLEFALSHRQLRSLFEQIEWNALVYSTDILNLQNVIDIYLNDINYTEKNIVDLIDIVVLNPYKK